jgi:hypothetical protein
MLVAVLRIPDILVWIRIWIRGSMPLTKGRAHPPPPSRHVGPSRHRTDTHLGKEEGGTSVADPGSGAFLTPGSGIRNRFFSDPGSRIPDPKPILLRV